VQRAHAEAIVVYDIAHGLKTTQSAQLGSPYFTRAHVSAIELGKILPALTTLVHFARKFGIELREILPP
jgi:transcriptional regulator with XRE-family HTH domain